MKCLLTPGFWVYPKISLGIGSGKKTFKSFAVLLRLRPKLYDEPSIAAEVPPYCHLLDPLMPFALLATAQNCLPMPSFTLYLNRFQLLCS